VQFHPLQRVVGGGARRVVHDLVEHDGGVGEQAARFQRFQT
jgi:hypothetical protein